MSKSNWLRAFVADFVSNRLKKGNSGRLTPAHFEQLENRTLLSAFTPGNIAVLDLAGTGNNTTGTILELGPSANQSTPVQSIPISATGANAVRFSDSGTSSFISDSNDGTQLVFAAYNTADNTTSDLATTGTNLTTGTDPDDRAVVTINSGGSLTIPSHYVEPTSGDQTRSAATLNDTNYYITDKGGLFTNGSTSASLSTNILNARAFGGTVYVSSTKGASGVSTLSSPTATSLGALPGLPADGSIQDFYLIQSGSNGSTYDVLYTLDQGTTNGTINKFSLVSGSWVANGSFTVTGDATGMIAENDGSGAYLYVVTTSQKTNNSVVRLTDPTGWVNSSTPSSGFAPTGLTTLYSDTTGDTIKGIAFAPAASPTTPTVSSPTSTSVAINTATLGGTVTSTGSTITSAGSNAITYGVVYSLTSQNNSPTLTGNNVMIAPGSGTPIFSPFTVSATGLQSGSQYSYAAYATNSAGTSYSSVGTFTTESGVPPVIDTPTDTGITNNRATLGATVESSGGSTITKTGVVYALATNTNPQLGEMGVTEVDTTSPVTSGAFTVAATGLSAGTNYVFEAFATNSSGTSYAAATPFTTLAAPTVQSPTVSTITSTSAALGGNITSNGGSTVTKWGVFYALTSDDSTPQMGGHNVTEVDATGSPGGAFTVPVSGLSGASSYSFEAFATNIYGTSYSAAGTFTTAAPGVITAWTFPTVAGAGDNSPAPTYGTGTATSLGMTNSYTNASGTGNTTSDDVLATAGTANTNFSENTWRIRGTPNNGWALAAPQYSQGIELDTSTVGYSNIVFSFDWYSTTQGIRDLQVQYNTGSGWVNYQGPSPTGTFVTSGNDYYNANLSPVNPTIYVNLGGIAAANNNSDLGIRLVSAYDSTGTLGNVYASAASTPADIIPYNNNSGNWRFGNLIFSAGTTTTTSITANPPVGQSPAQPVTFTATVTPAGGSQFPSGTVNFYDGATLIGSQSVTQVGVTNVGTASIMLTTLAPGVHGDITAQYAPASGNGLIASGSSMNLVAGDPTDNPISYTINAPQATGVDVSPVAGQSFTGVVATFSDGTFTNPTGFSASINWGDGNTSSGVIAFAGTTNETNINGQIVPVSLFTVTATNTYAAAGTDTITLTVTDPNNNSATVNPTARVAYAPLAVTAAGTLDTTYGASFTNQTVATFTDPGLVANAAALGISDLTTQFSANISWGDNSTTPGTITYDPTSQTFSVVGSHSYAQTGSYSISVAVTPMTLSVERIDSSDPTDLNEVGDENDNHLTDSPSADFIDQFAIDSSTAATSALYTTSLPTVATTGGNEALTNSSYSVSEGEMTLSSNGEYLVTGGYNDTVSAWAPQQTFSPASVINRVIGTIDGQGNINTTTDLTDAYSGDNFRGVASDNGTEFWTAGHATGATNDYVHYAQLGATTSTTITGPNSAFNPENINTVEIINGQLYEGVRSAGGATAPAGIYQIGTGLPTSANQDETLFIPLPQSNPLDITAGDKPMAPFEFWMTDLPGNPNSVNGVNVAYVADADMGIARYDYGASGWQFSYYIDSTGAFKDSVYTVNSDGSVSATAAFNATNPIPASDPNADPTKAGGVRGLTGMVVDGQVELFGITGYGTGSQPNPGGSLIEVTDTGANAAYKTLAINPTTDPSELTSVAFSPTAVVTGSAQVAAANQSIIFTAPTSPITFSPNEMVTLNATGGASGNPVVFSIDSGSTGTGNISGNTLTITGAGTFVLDANQAGNTNYNAAPQVQQTLVVNAADQSINFTAPTSPITFSPNEMVTLSATGGASGNAVVFNVDPVSTGTGTISGDALTVTGAGNILLDANEAGNTNYNAAPQVQQTLVVNAAGQTINFTAPTSPIAFSPNEMVTLSATGGASGNAVVFSVDPVSTGTGTISGDVLTITGAGNFVLDANQAGNTNYTAAPQVQQMLVVSQASQAINFTAPTSPITFSPNEMVTLSATGGASGNAVVFSIDAISTGTGSISGNVLTITGAGTFVLDANQAGNSNYNAAPQVQRSLVVNKASQTINFTAPSSPITFSPNETVTLSATGGASGNAVVFTIDSSSTGTGSISGNVLTITGAGNFVLDANQAGNGNYNAALLVQRSLVVNKASQTINFTAPSSPITFSPNETVTLSATGGASGNAVVFTIDSSSTGTGSISGNVLTITGAGTFVLDANQAGNSDYNAAPQVQQSLVVNKASTSPTIGILLLDKTGSGALTDSGSASVKVTNGSIDVNSTSTSAIAVSGAATVSATQVNDAGGDSVTGSGKITGTLKTKTTPVADPLGTLTAPNPSTMTVQSSSALSIGGVSNITLQPGLYIGGINIGGSAKVTLAPGIYYLEGGGFTVGGAAIVTDLGKGVLLYNAAVKTSDSINVSGSGKLTLSPMTSGLYEGLVIFQTRTATAALSFSGAAVVDLTGTVYAASAAFNISGSAAVQINDSPLDSISSMLIVDDLNDSGAATLSITV